MKPWAIALCAVLLSACAAPPAPPPPVDQQLFSDRLFAPPTEDVSAANLFTLTPAMQRYVQQEVLRSQQGKSTQQALFDALYKKDKLQLEYDSTMTRNAEQAFEARSGNCLSLVIMTAALAREANLSVEYQRVEVGDSWSRSGNLYFSAGHVNLKLGKSKLTLDRSYDPNAFMTIDFLPPEDLKLQVAQSLEEKTIVAMYMNNRAVENMVQNHLDNAYWWARNAIQRDPGFLNAYNSLGVIYEHHGNPAEAEHVLRYAYQQQPANTIIMFNLAQALRDLGRTTEAQALQEELARLEPHPPFFFFNLGRAAMQAGDYAHARNMFTRELARDPNYHEFHFWLAVADYRLGDLKDADKHMKIALENSTTRGDHDLYAAKLDRIKAYERTQLGQ